MVAIEIHIDINGIGQPVPVGVAGNQNANLFFVGKVLDNREALVGEYRCLIWEAIGIDRVTSLVDFFPVIEAVTVSIRLFGIGLLNDDLVYPVRSLPRY